MNGLTTSGKSRTKIERLNKVSKVSNESNSSVIRGLPSEWARATKMVSQRAMLVASLLFPAVLTYQPLEAYLSPIVSEQGAESESPSVWCVCIYKVARA